ncbi:MAG TPA: CocE/NonD family hydrolase [Solirubrobacteraceae bacterium]|jgi:hypothetical protein|nr:CocE/NonD family hydrolase [Solirubrobacteraceae bacterium]
MTEMLVESGVAVPMRDGVVLQADVYRPATGRVPAILNRTPYNRSFNLTPAAAIEPERAVEAGFALVCQDVRGQHGSDGEFYPFRNERDDGYDSVEWAAAQPWCDGAVGMAGRSYSAATQWLAAAARPPHLRAICPVVVGSDPYGGWIYQGGAFQLGFNLFWVSMMSTRKARRSLAESFAHLPLSSPPLLDESPAGAFYRDWLAHPADDGYWHALAISHQYPLVEVPVLNVGGWYDLFLGGTLENYRGIRERGGSELAREASRLLVGPWAHGTTYGAFPDHSFDAFSPHDGIDFAAVQLAFLGRHLRGDKGPELAPVRVFQMGTNVWREEERWPPPAAGEQRWYLHADAGPGAAGTLSPQPPEVDPRPPSTYVHDPLDPVPTIGGPTSLPARFMRTNAGPLDQRKLLERPDVLVFRSAPLERPLGLCGPLALVLHAATSAADTDFVGRLCDEAPDGTCTILVEGVRRARYREGFDRPRPIRTGAVLAYEIDLVATCAELGAGHRLCLIVASSSFPRFDRNLGTGAELGSEVEADAVRAEQSIFHDGPRPSHLRLTVEVR